MLPTVPLLVASTKSEFLPSVCPPEYDYRVLNMRRYEVDGLVVKNTMVAWLTALPLCDTLLENALFVLYLRVATHCCALLLLLPRTTRSWVYCREPGCYA